MYSGKFFFCPWTSKLILGQIFEIYIVGFLGGLLKMLGNLTLICISFNRFILLDGGFLRMYRKLSSSIGKRKYCSIFLMIILLAVLQTEVLFNEKLNKNYKVLDNLYDYKEYPYRNPFIMVFLDTWQNLQFYSPLLSYFVYVIFILKFIVNDLLFLLLFLIVELLTIIKTKANLKIKIKVNHSMNKTSLAYLEYSFRKKTAIILFNSFIQINLKGFDFVISSFLAWKKLTDTNPKLNICFRFHKVCTILDEINEINYMITISYLTLIYFYLNKTFKSILRENFKKIYNLFS